MSQYRIRLVLFKLYRIVPEAESTKAANMLSVTVPPGLVSGFFTGAVGLSEYTNLSSCSIGLLDFYPIKAIDTATRAATLLNPSGAIIHASSVYIDIEILLTKEIGSVVETRFGAKIAPKINRKISTVPLELISIGSGFYQVIHDLPRAQVT